MTNDEILKVARECAIWDDSDELITFAHRIAAMQRDLDARICAKWVDVNHVYTNGAIQCAKAIRGQA